MRKIYSIISGNMNKALFLEWACSTTIIRLNSGTNLVMVCRHILL